MRENDNKKASCARFFNMRAFTQNRTSILCGLNYVTYKYYVLYEE